MGRHERGFSRLDLAAVVVVVVVIAATVTPALFRMGNTARLSVVKGAVDRLASSVELAHALWLGRRARAVSNTVALGDLRVSMNENGWPRARDVLDCSNNIWGLAMGRRPSAALVVRPKPGRYTASLVNGTCIYDYGVSSDIRITYDPKSGMVAMRSQ